MFQAAWGEVRVYVLRMKLCYVPGCVGGSMCVCPENEALLCSRLRGGKYVCMSGNKALTLFYSLSLSAVL